MVTGNVADHLVEHGFRYRCLDLHLVKCEQDGVHHLLPHRSSVIHDPAIAAAFYFYLIATQIGQEYLADTGSILHTERLVITPKLPVP